MDCYEAKTYISVMNKKHVPWFTPEVEAYIFGTVVCCTYVCETRLTANLHKLHVMVGWDKNLVCSRRNVRTACANSA